MPCKCRVSARRCGHGQGMGRGLLIWEGTERMCSHACTVLGAPAQATGAREGASSLGEVCACSPKREARDLLLPTVWLSEKLSGLLLSHPLTGGPNSPVGSAHRIFCSVHVTM